MDTAHATTSAAHAVPLQASPAEGAGAIDTAGQVAPDGGGGGSGSGEGGGGTLDQEGQNFIQRGPSASRRETELREFYGLTPKQAATFRHRWLTETVHWKKEGGEICYTDAGLLEMANRMGAGLPPDENKKEGAPPGPPGEEGAVTMVLLKVKLTNPRIVLGRKKEDAPEAGASVPVLRLKVKSSLNFRVGMEVPNCHAVDPDAGLYEFRGRHPRFPGKW